jgi:hypothetical protein
VKYKIVEPPLSEQEKALQEVEATILAHLEEMGKAGDSNFEDWLACEQVGQMRALQGIADMLYRWNQKGVPVYPIAT